MDRPANAGRALTRRAVWGWVMVLAGTSLVAGCLRPRTPPVPLDPIPMQEAAAISNANAARIDGTLRAIGWVDGSFVTEGGRKRSYSVDAVLFFLRPSFVRFDLKSFGQRRFLFGSNTGRYWFFDQEREAYECGWHDDEDELAADMPIKPRQLVDALGLSLIPDDPAESESARIVQRVVEEYQQILVLTRGSSGGWIVEKEYWLDRFEPRLVRRVVFRDRDGVAELESRLDDYKPLGPGGAMLPGVMSADWPKSKAHMRFRVGKWTSVPQVGPGGPQFATPGECD